MLEVRPPPVPDLPPITQTTFLTCRAQYPGGPNRCVSVSSLSARPSPFNGRVGIHNFTFEACSSFTRVTACKIACPPKGGLLSRGFDPASYPTKPLGSYHVLPTTTWMDPPSTGDLRRWGARRVEEGRWTGTYWQPVVSLPRSSNWTCSFRTSSFPTGFTAAPTRAVHTTWCRATAPRISRFALRHSGIERSSVLRGVVDSSSITALFPLSPAHQKQGSFPPPVLPSIHGTVTLSDFRTGHPPIEDVGGATPPAPGLPQLPRPPFLHAVLSTPADRTGACRFLPCPRGLPRLTGGSASTTSLSRPAQASLALRVAVGTAVTRCPPHRPVLALLVHTVPTLDVWRRSARWDKDVRYGFQEAGQPAAPESAPRSNGSVDYAAEAGAATSVAHLSETPSVDARCPVRRDIGNTPSPQTATTSGCPRWTRACAAAASP